MMLLSLDPTFREFRKQKFDHGIALETTGLETRPTFSFLQR
jgi:hypothetical protein